MGATSTDAPRVVVVDPDDDDRARAVQALRDDGIDVVAEAKEYAGGLLEAQAHKPDVVVSEVHVGQLLPVNEYLLALRRKSGGVVIVYSAERPATAEFVAWGIYGTALKGEPLGELVGLVRRAYDFGVRHAIR